MSPVGVKRSNRVFTTKSFPARARPTDLVQRHFRAAAPHRLWVVDVTDVRAWHGFACVAFITDVPPGGSSDSTSLRR